MIKENLWQFSTKRGDAVEKFATEVLFPSIGLKCIKNNKDNVRDIDLLLENIPLEIKTAFTPYPKDKTPAGLTGAEHLTLDLANIDKYSRDVYLLFIVRYAAPKVCMIQVGQIKDIIAANPKRIYTRSSRSRMDKQKKVGIAFGECHDITELFPRDVVNLIETLP